MNATYDRLIEPAFLTRAFDDVKQKRGSAGADRVTVADFERTAEERVGKLAHELASGTYRPAPVLRVIIRSKGKTRLLAVPTVRDRVVHRALALILQSVFEPSFTEASWAFRPGRGAMEAARRVARCLGGKTVGAVLLADIERFFDNIDHSILMLKLMAHVKDDRLLTFVHRLVRARVFDHMALSECVVGLHQGSPLSPLLSNIYLNDFDRGLSKQGYAVFRYCDDMAILCRGESEARAALALSESRLSELQLRLNLEKTQIVKPPSPFVFLGYQFSGGRIGPSRKASAALMSQLAVLGSNPAETPVSLDACLRGWLAYYGQAPANLETTPEGLLARFRLGSLRCKGVEAEFPARLGQHRAAWVHMGLAIELARRRLDAFCWNELLKVPPDFFSAASDLDALARQIGFNGADVGLLVMTHKVASLGDAGRRRAALLLHKKGLNRPAEALMKAISPDGATSIPSAVCPGELPVAVMHRFLALFSGLENAYAREVIDAKGQRRYEKVAKPLTVDVLRQHFAGRQTLGIYVFRSNFTVRVLVLDVDVKTERIKSPDSDMVADIQRAQRFARRLAGAARRLGLDPLLEDSGFKGRHVWIFFREAVPASWARVVATKLVDRAGDPPAFLRCEIFPDRDRVRRGQTGPVIKLPLGLHGRSGRRCALLTRNGEVIEDPSRTLFRQQALSRRLLAQMVRQWQWQPTLAAAMPPAVKQLGTQTGLAESCSPSAEARYNEAFDAGEDTTFESLPAVVRVLEGCNLLRHLYHKARQTFYLTHGERLAILYGIGHLGAESEPAIHRIMSFTINYSSAVTQKWFDSKKSHPMSCIRYRGRFRMLTARLRCDCRFTLGRGEYPAPALHAIRVPQGSAEESLLNGRAANVAAKPTAPAGLHPLPAHELAQPAGDSVVQLVDRLLNLQSRQRDVAQALDETADRLDVAFDQAGTDTLKTARGVITRHRHDGKSRFHIEQ